MKRKPEPQPELTPLDALVKALDQKQASLNPPSDTRATLIVQMHALEQEHIKRDDERVATRESNEHQRQADTDRREHSAKLLGIIGGYISDDSHRLQLLLHRLRDTKPTRTNRHRGRILHREGSPEIQGPDGERLASFKPGRSIEYRTDLVLPSANSTYAAMLSNLARYLK